MTQKVAFIYGTQSGILRRIVIPDRDESLAGHVGPGENIVIADAADGISPERGRMLIEIETGKPSPEGRCAVVDAKTNKVIGAMLADPQIDVFTGCYLVAHAEATEGWVYDPAAKTLTDPNPDAPPTEEEIAASLARREAKAKETTV